jgi:hypothetical protein
MVRQIKFCWYCVTNAWSGCWTRTNEVYAVLGGILLTVTLWLLRDRTVVGAPATIWGTGLLAVLMAIASFFLALVLIFITRLVLAPARLFWTEREKVQGFELKAQTISSGLPDWPIGELFCHVDPDVLDRTAEGEPYQVVANKLKDAFALNQLKIWGREVDDAGLGKMLGEIKPLTLIDPAYWQASHFTFNFFDSTANEQPHTYVDQRSGLPEYTDLQVNRAEAISIWPSDSAERKFQLQIAENYPNVRIADNPSIHGDILNGADRQKFLALLSAGILTGWARPIVGNSDFVKIPEASWEAHKIEVLLNSGQSIDQDGVHRIHHQSFIRSKRRNEATHYDVCVNRAQMSKIWENYAFSIDDGSGA